MRMSQQWTTTLREAPHDSESGNQELLVRAGFIRQLTSGVYSFLPLGYRVIRKISQIMREEMDRVGGQEISMPIIQPKELWEKQPANGGPSRSEAMGEVLFRLKDRKNRDMVLGPTHEEVVTNLTKEFVRSYRDLPQLIYQIQTKLRDEPRPRGGLLRVREFVMKDLYSFDADTQGLDSSYRKVSDAYRAFFTRCGVRFVVIEADSGPIGGKDSQEFLGITEAGEDDAMLCENGDYAANKEKAVFVRSELEKEMEAAIELVHTPNCMEISKLANFLHVPSAKIIKTICYLASQKLVLVIVRGDLEVNEVKLSNVLYRLGINAADMHLANAEELIAAGIVAGYTSPLEKDDEILIIADSSLQAGNNFVAGANKVNYHVKNVNYPRDFRIDQWEDVASAFDGVTCVRCGGQLHAIRGTEVGHIFKLGTKYSDLFDAQYLDTEGTAHPILMGCYGIGIGRAMATIAEQNYDAKGMRWPFSIAPYHVALIGLDLDKLEIRQVAEQLYADLTEAHVEVLFDDRTETAGVKFNDADLIGLPLRAVVSKRSLKNGGIELKLRSQQESRIVPLSDIVHTIQEEIRRGIMVLEQ